MSASRELIVAAKARADAATVGPWRHIETPYGESVEVDDGDEGAQLFIETHGVTYAWNGSNAEFIAASREDVPVMADALLRVLNLHAPEEVTVLAQSASPGYEEWPLADVDVCSLCLPDHVRERIEDEEADESDVRPFLHPCATVRAVTGDGSSSDTERRTT